MALHLSRRALLATAASSGVMTPLAPGLKAAFAADGQSHGRDILLVVFLRFGCDGLTLIPPADDADYHRNRPTLAIRAAGANAALPLSTLGSVQFFMNPNLPELKALYDDQKLAVVHAAGLPTESRSHFVSQDKMERGIADGEAPISGGWIGRHLTARALTLPGLGAISTTSDVDVSLQGYPGAIGFPDASRFEVAGGDLNMNVIERMNAGAEPWVISARATIDTIKTVQSKLSAVPAMAANAAGYTTGALSQSLRSVANIIKADIGLEIATVDYGGWDHHTGLATFFGPQARELSRALAAFWTDMKDVQDRLTIVTMTEFGRRVEENANGGLDHGSASVMLALGGHVAGGRMYGQWPGLKDADLHVGDLRVTTDYRRVLQEILAKRRGETTPRAVFPTVAYQPLGLMTGDDSGVVGQTSAP